MSAMIVFGVSNIFPDNSKTVFFSGKTFGINLHSAKHSKKSKKEFSLKCDERKIFALFKNFLL